MNKKTLTNIVNETVEEFQTLGAEEIADAILNKSITPRLKNDQSFLIEMKSHFIKGRNGDKVSFDLVEDMIEDWIFELEEQIND